MKTIKLILVLILIGVWANVYLNFNASQKVKKVKVINDLTIKEIQNTLDVNLQEINGRRNAFYQDSDGEYVLIPVYTK